jgi:hypothetical protein
MKIQTNEVQQELVSKFILNSKSCTSCLLLVFRQAFLHSLLIVDGTWKDQSGVEYGKEGGSTCVSGEGRI